MRKVVASPFLLVAAYAVAFDVANADEEPVRKSPVQCVNAPVNDTRIIDDRTLIIVDRDGHAASLTLSGPCLRDRSTAVIIKYNANGDRICHPADADITSGRSVPLTCGIKTLEMMSAEEARAQLKP